MCFFLQEKKTSARNQMPDFKLRLGRRTFLFTRVEMQSRPVQFLLDFSGSMAIHFEHLIDIAVKAVQNGGNAVAFSTSALLLSDGLTAESFPKIGPHYGCGTGYADGFRALQEFLTPDTTVVMLTDGEPTDRPDALKEVKILHSTLAEGAGQLGVYFLGQPNERQMDTMQQLLFRTEKPLVFDGRVMEDLLYGELAKSVPVKAEGEGVVTGIWKVTAEDLKEEEELPDLSAVARPEVALACFASLLNFMARKNIAMSWEDAKELNKLLERHHAFPGVVALMASMRHFAASCGLSRLDNGAVARLLASVNIVTGRVPDEAIIQQALLALVKNPDPAYAQQSRAERDRLKAAQKRRARLGDTLKHMNKQIEEAALAAERFFQTKTKSYRFQTRDLEDGSEGSKAISLNPQCFDVQCDGRLYDFALANGDYVLLPPSCQSADYIQAALFSLTNNTLHTQQLRFCLLNPVWTNPAMRKDVTRLLRLLPPPQCFALPDAVKPRAFMFNPTQCSAKTFFFFPFMIDGSPYQTHEAFVQALVPILHQACGARPLDPARLTSAAPRSVPDLVRRLHAEPNVAQLCAEAVPLAHYDTEIDPAEATRLADEVLVSYSHAAPALAGVAPPIPTKQQLLALLMSGVEERLPDHRGWPPDVTAAALIVTAALRLSVAASLKLTSSTERYESSVITLARTGLTFAPSEEVAKTVLLAEVGDDLVARARLGADWDLKDLPRLDPDIDPLVYLQLCNHDPVKLKHVLDRVDWARYSPQSTWPQTALKCAATLPIGDALAAFEVAKLAHTFNGSALQAAEIARILTQVESCAVTGHTVRDPPILSFIPFDARNMRNALTLLEDPAKGLELLQRDEGGSLSKDQYAVALGLRKLGVDVSNVGPLLQTSALHERVASRWLSTLRDPSDPDALLRFFRAKHPTGYRLGMSPADYYSRRIELFAAQGGRALFRTELFGIMLDRAGVFGR